MHFIIAYDVQRDKRRNQVMNALKDVGVRVQYSVFECDLPFDRAIALMLRLRALIDLRRDRIHMYPLCNACYFRSESAGKEWQ